LTGSWIQTPAIAPTSGQDPSVTSPDALAKMERRLIVGMGNVSKEESTQMVSSWHHFANARLGGRARIATPAFRIRCARTYRPKLTNVSIHGSAIARVTRQWTTMRRTNTAKSGSQKTFLQVLGLQGMTAFASVRILSMLPEGIAVTMGRLVTTHGAHGVTFIMTSCRTTRWPGYFTEVDP